MLQLLHLLGQKAQVTFGYEAGWVPESFWMLRRKEKGCTTGNRTRTIQSIVIPILLSQLLINIERKIKISITA
jgi:hypothetical protein